jgi:hypothetical protein
MLHILFLHSKIYRLCKLIFVRLAPFKMRCIFCIFQDRRVVIFHFFIYCFLFFIYPLMDLYYDFDFSLDFYLWENLSLFTHFLQLYLDFISCLNLFLWIITKFLGYLIYSIVKWSDFFKSLNFKELKNCFGLIIWVY